jgi:hypothetical protein
MNIQEWIEFFEENEVNEKALSAFKVRNVNTIKEKRDLNAPVIQTNQDDLQVTNASALDAIEGGFELTYQPSRHEAGWLFNALGGFFLDQWFDDILRMVKGGKEASVYLCKAHESVGIPYLAAKVYRPRQFRNLRKDHVYREGRSYIDGEGHVILDHGQLNAIQKKTGYGRQLAHVSWIEYEVKAMKTLYKAGGDVPKLYASSGMALIMD